MSTDKKPSSAQRTRTYRERLAEKGFCNINVAVDAETARTLRAISREHRRSLSEVIMVGARLSRHALAGTITKATSAGAPEKPVVPAVTNAAPADAGSATAEARTTGAAVEPDSAIGEQPPVAAAGSDSAAAAIDQEVFESGADSPEVNADSAVSDIAAVTEADSPHDADADDMRIARAAQTAEAATAE